MRDQQLRNALTESFGELLVIASEPPNPSGVWFSEPYDWNVIVHPAQLIVMSEALSDHEFDLFVAGLVTFIGFALEILENGEFVDIDDAVLTAQSLTAEQSPEQYAMLNNVFDL